MISSFITLLQKAGWEPTEDEIKDALWLADCIAVSTSDTQAPAPSPDEQLARPIPPPTPPPVNTGGGAENANPPEELRRAVPDIPSEVPAPKYERARPFLSPGFRAFGNDLAIGRALRPLRKRVPSRRDVIYDEQATIEASTRLGLRGVLVPVVRRPREKWLELALVVDNSESMSLWGPMLADLKLTFSRLGIFSDVRVWHLSTSGDEALLVKPTAQTSANLRRTLKDLFDPSGRRVVVVATNCVAKAWRTGAAQRELALVARKAPLALLQVLPEELWVRTVMRTAQNVKLRSARAAAPCANLHATPSALPEHHPAIPVLTLQPKMLRAWASVVANTPEAWAPGVAFRLVNEPATEQAAELSGEDRVRRFTRSASLKARQLAELFSAVPLYPPIMRLVAGAMLPDATADHMTEVFLGGLLQRVTPADRLVDPDHVKYEFLPGVRDALTTGISSKAGLEIIRRVSDFVQGESTHVHGFRALLLDESYGTDGSFALLRAPFLRRIKVPPPQPAPPITDAPTSLVPSAQPHGDFSLPDEIEVPVPNGCWVLVDCAPDADVAPHQLTIAAHLGRALALAGFSVVGLAIKSVSNTAAQSFLEALQPQNVVEPSPSELVTQARRVGRLVLSSGLGAVRKADAVLFIGTPMDASDIERSAACEVISVVDCQYGKQPFASVRPDNWTPTATRLFCREIVQHLARTLKVTNDALPTPYRQLLARATLVLGQEDESRYELHLLHLRREVPADFDESLIARFACDARRPALRLIGLLLLRRPDLEVFRRALDAELTWIRRFESARTFQVALQRIAEFIDAGTWRDDESVASTCAIAVGGLRDAASFDGIKRSLETWSHLTAVNRTFERAQLLHALSEDYEEQARNPSANHETLHRVVERIRELAPARRGTEANTWFRGGRLGHRVVALSLLMPAQRSSHGFDLALETIEKGATNFERRLALEALLSMVSSLAPSELLLVHETLGKHDAFPLPSPRTSKADRAKLTTLYHSVCAEVRKRIAGEGFLDEVLIRHWLEEHGHLRNDEEILEMLLIFSTSKQHTWLISTPGRVICILDDRETREAERLVQFDVTPDALRPVSTESRTARDSGVLVIGKRRYYYSPRLFPEPSELVSIVESFLELADRALAAVASAGVAGSVPTLEGTELFVNREAELAEFTRLLRNGVQRGLLVISGAAGIGKTAFARRCARLAAEEGSFPVFMSFEGTKVSYKSALRMIAAECARQLRLPAVHAFAAMANNPRPNISSSTFWGLLPSRVIVFIDASDAVEKPVWDLATELNEAHRQLRFVLMARHVHRLHANVAFQHIKLGPLDQHAVERWLRATLDNVDAAHIQSIVRAGNGVPGKVAQIIESMAHARLETQQEGRRASPISVAKIEGPTAVPMMDDESERHGPFVVTRGPHTLRIPAVFGMGIAPVTNCEFLRFVEAEGYAKDDFWKGVAPRLRRKFLTKDGITQGPGCWPSSRMFNLGPDHPVTGVCYEEALAFVQWLNAEVKPPFGSEWCLPTEDMWERAARGLEETQYPWGNEFEEGRCNTREAGLGHTTPRGSYGKGVSSAGCEDMAGNVWELVRVAAEDGFCVLRGGGFKNTQEEVKSSIRLVRVPREHRPDDFGFRCAVV